MTIDSQFLLTLLIRVPPVIFSLCMHELMHGWAALINGDSTAKDEGRLTLNPLAHLDPVGTLFLLFAPFGWAKPVPVMPENFRHRKRGEVMVALAGVTSNLLMALLFSMVFRLLVHAGFKPQGAVGAVLLLMLYMAIVVNYGLCMFNLLPIAPLDGHHVVRELLPQRARARFMEYSRYGWILLLGLVFLHQGSGLQVLLYPITPLVKLSAGPELNGYLEEAQRVLNQFLSS